MFELCEKRVKTSVWIRRSGVIGQQACLRINTLFQFVWTHRTEVQSSPDDSLTVVTETTQDEITLTK